MKDMFERRFLILALLFMAKVAPTMFFMMALPVILRIEGYSLEVIGLLQLAGMFYLFKFLWAPLLDRNGTDENHYKRWTLWTGLVYGGLLVVLGFFDLQNHFSLVVALVMVISVVASTQNIAISALYIKSLNFAERGVGSSTKIFAVNLASILGSGFFLIVYNHFGWQVSVTGMAALVFLSLLPLPLLSEPCQPGERGNGFCWSAIFSFFKAPGMVRWFVLIVLNSLSASGVYFAFKPFLVDRGVTADTIAFMLGFYGMSVAALAAAITGAQRFQAFLIRRRRACIGSVAINAVALILFVPMALSSDSQWLLYLAVGLINVSITIASVISGTLVMDFSRHGFESVDYSLQMTGIHLGGLLMASVSGMIVAAIGYQAFFVAQALLSGLMIPLTAVLFRGHWVRGSNRVDACDDAAD